VPVGDGHCLHGQRVDHGNTALTGVERMLVAATASDVSCRLCCTQWPRMTMNHSLTS